MRFRTTSRVRAWSVWRPGGVNASGFPLAGRDVAPSRPRLQALDGELDLELVDLPVSLGWGKANQVLAMEFVGHLRECGGEVLAESDLGVSTAGFFSDASETGIGKVRHQRRLQTARTDPRYLRSCTATAHADAVQHYPLPPCPLDHLALAGHALTKIDRTERPAVLAVAEHEDHRPLIGPTFRTGRLKRIERLLEGAPERGRRVGRYGTR